jgi:hypothetical protein
MLLVLLLAPVVLGLQPTIRSLSPDRGFDAGGFRITIEGENLPFLKEQVTVLVGAQLCEDVRVEAPWSRVSCLVAPCPGCVREAVVVNVNGKLSNQLWLEFAGLCMGQPLRPGKPSEKLPSMYSAEENCTVCRVLVNGAVTAAPDLVSYESLRTAMRDVCGSPVVRQYRSIDPSCRKETRDYFIPVSRGCVLVRRGDNDDGSLPQCASLLFAEQDELLDVIWSRWSVDYDLGGLVEYACRQIGRCGGAYSQL